jgi:hypothetical protein
MNPPIAKDSRCFELRTYHCPPGKLEALHARFRDHTCKLFTKHSMEIIGFWTPTDKEHANKLVYVVAHESREAAEKSWDAFCDDPEWLKVRNESEVNGKLVEKIESVYMTATDYSPLK